MQTSDEATQEQLQLAIKQGDAYQQALDYMVSEEAVGGETRKTRTPTLKSQSATEAMAVLSRG